MHPDDDRETDQRYRTLAVVLQMAYQQAASGKGAKRHGKDLPFTEQPLFRLMDL